MLSGGYPATGAEPLPIIEGVASQPFAAQAERVSEALRFLGRPLSPAQNESLSKAIQQPDEALVSKEIQRILDPLTLAYVTINPESRVKARKGMAPARLLQNGWTVFLVKVYNRAGVTAPLIIESSNAAPIFRRSRSSSKPNNPFNPKLIRERWLSIETYNKPRWPPL